MDPNSNPIGSALSTLLAPISGAVTDISNLTAPDFNSLFQNAYNDLSTYYGDLSSQDQSDYNLLTQNLQTDENNAISYANEDLAQTTQQTNDNLTSGLTQDTLTREQENRGMQNTLNQRGIALTQNENGSLQYAGGGESGYELGAQTQAQQLRREALDRSAQQTVQGATTKQQQSVGSAQQSFAEGTQSASQQLRNEQQQLYQSRTSQAQGMAQLAAGQQLNEQQLAISKQGLNNQTGSSGGGTLSPGQNGAPGYAPNVQNQTVSMGGHTYKGNPGSGWSQVS